LAFLHEPALRRLAIGTPFNHDPVRPWEAAWYYPGTTSWRYRGGRSEPAGLQFTQDPKTGRVVRFFVQPRPGMPHQVDFLEQAELRQGERCPFEATP